MPYSTRISRILVAAFPLILVGALLAGCGAASAGRRPTPIPTVPYLAPTVVPTPVRATETPSPTATPAPASQSAAPTATPRPSVPGGPDPQGGVPNVAGQLILVNLSQQWLWAYQNGQLLYRTPVTSGRPELPTPTGTYQIRFKQNNVTFYSPWPQGSPYYYSPEHINYAMYFADDGYYIHDAPWRQVFGPGTSIPHTDPNGEQTTGSHGCVETPTPAGAWLYAWAHDGATVIITGVSPSAPPAPQPTATAVPPAPTPTAPPATPTPTPSPTPSPIATPSAPPA